MPPLRSISRLPDETATFNLKPVMKIAPVPTIVGVVVSADFGTDRSCGLGYADRKVAYDRDGLGEV
jgi:hypothetical protein